MDYCSWGNMLPDYWNQCGCAAIRDCLKEATTMLAHTTEYPALSNHVSYIVFALGHQGLLGKGANSDLNKSRR